METISLTKTLASIREYKAAFIPDGGVMNSDNLTKAAYIQAIGDEMSESIQFSYLGFAATKLRPDGVNNFVEKVYDTSINGDGTQTTELNQPYEANNIALNEHKAIKNPYGDTRYITHPEISFAADEPWSVTTVIEGYIGTYAGDRTTNGDFIGDISGLVSFRNTAKIIFYSNQSVSIFNGKHRIITFTGDGSIIKIFIDGILKDEATITTSIRFNTLLNGYYLAGNYTEGTISAHVIRDIALTPSQVLAEAEFLQTIYPEIPSVKIGEQDWATSNVATTSLDVVASSDGTVIAEASDNADWATGAARWRYYNDDSEIGSWGNKLYNKAARDVIIANPPENWHVATEAELTTLATYGGDKLKVEDADYWTTANGTNHSGLSSVGSGMVNTDGTFTGINTTVGFWCADSDKALIITDAGAATITSVSANEGYSIRLIHD